MGLDMASDFVLDSMGHCFFCLCRILPIEQELELATVPPTFPKYPLQCFSRYLKMDMRKVFRSEGQTPSQLVDEVGRSRLKVELCEGCARLNDKVTELYRKLEKLEMEMGSWLSLIGEKLSEANMTSKTEEFKKLTSLDSDIKWSGVLEIMEVLRLEAIQKCSSKLHAVTPRVKCQNLTTKEVNKELSQFKTNCVASTTAQTTSNSAGTGTPSLDNISDIKMELDIPTTGFLSDDDNNSSHFSDDVKLYDGTIEEKAWTKTKNRVNYDANHTVTGGQITVSPSPFIISNPPAKRKLNIAQGKTSEHKCDVCSRKFKSRWALQSHHGSAHLNIRYKCESCNALFTQMGSLNKHSMTSCAAKPISVLKPKCPICKKTFSRKDNLQVHLRSFHFQLREYECEHCGKKFNTNQLLTKHKKRSCRLIK